jgi:NADH-quinone oxidoreductase subunit M
MLSLYKKSFFGPVTNEENNKLVDLSKVEIFSLVPLVAIVVWLGVYPKPILEPIDNSVKAMVEFMDKKAITQEAKDVIRASKIKMEVK